MTLTLLRKVIRLRQNVGRRPRGAIHELEVEAE
jgi:hypothetical protein